MADDRVLSRRTLVPLEATKFTYPGWQDEYRAIQEQMEHCHPSTNDDPLSHVRDRILGMINRQRMHDGDRSHPQLAKLDAMHLSYPGWQADIERMERTHVRFPSLFEEQLEFLSRKQRIVDGGTVSQVTPSGSPSSPSACSGTGGGRIYESCFRRLEVDEITQSNASNAENCVVCFGSDREYAFVPCGHLCVCWDCASCIANHDRRCPLCRVEASHVMKIYS